jgi:hypothetical protein
MTDYLATARRQIAEEDAALMAARVRDRAEALRKADENRAPALPTDAAQMRAMLASLYSSRDYLLARQHEAKKNPLRPTSAEQDAALTRMVQQIDTLERNLAALGRLAGKVAA